MNLHRHLFRPILPVLAVLAATAQTPTTPTTQNSPAVGSWFGRAVPFNPPCPPATAGCPIPAEIVMLPTFYADGNFLGIDSNVFVGFHSTAHGGWQHNDANTVEANFVWLQAGEQILSFEGAFRVRFVARMSPDNKDSMTGFIQAYFFPFVDQATKRVILDDKNLPVPDPIGRPLPAACTPQTGCLGTFTFNLRRIKVDREAGSPPASVASLTATPAVINSTTGLGSTKLTWFAPIAQRVEVRVGSPDGTLLGGGGPSGEASTGDWVRDGMTFYLQDVSDGRPLTAANTLATARVSVQPR